MDQKRRPWKRRALAAIFLGAVAVDLYGYGGEQGGKILRSNDVTQPAAPYYEGLGGALNFGWNSFKDLVTGINDIVQRHDRAPKP